MINDNLKRCIILYTISKYFYKSARPQKALGPGQAPSSLAPMVGPGEHRKICSRISRTYCMIMTSTMTFERHSVFSGLKV